MTEAEWLVSNDPVPLMQFVIGNASERKLRLQLVAMARIVWDRIPEGELRDAVIASEEHADGLTPATTVDEFRSKCYGWAQSAAPTEKKAFFHSPLTNPIFTLARMTTYSAPMLRRLTVQNSNWNYQSRRLGSTAVQLMHDIFGNPFRPVAFDPAWRTDTVMALARRAYDAHEFGALPILADALQDAGCDSEDLLNHLRDTSATHVRGCWALDLVLGKE